MMKKLKLISLASILGISITSCATSASKCCSKDCKTNLQPVDIVQEKEGNKSEYMKTDINSEEPLVCLLVGEEFASRKEMLQKEIFSEIKELKELEDGYIFYFKYDETFFMKMSDYVVTENICCPFFTFEIKLHAKNDIQLKVTGPEQAKEMIKMELFDKK